MNLLDLSAKLSLDSSGYDRGLRDSEESAESFGRRALGKFGSFAKGAAGFAKDTAVAASKVALGAMTASTGAVVAITKQAVDAYADYEQLTGGVETLFNKSVDNFDDYKKMVAGSTEDIKKFQRENNLVVDGILGPKTQAALEARYAEVGNITVSAADIVMQNARDAYKNVGMSANEYMETVTGFSASLIASMGGDTEAAATKADQAITDMADNANKMGSDISSIQTAYAGFSKQNYTMLDNLNKMGALAA